MRIHFNFRHPRFTANMDLVTQSPAGVRVGAALSQVFLQQSTWLGKKAGRAFRPQEVSIRDFLGGPVLRNPSPT